MKRVYNFLKILFSAIWLALFTICAFWLCDGKHLTVAYTFIGLSLVVAFIIYAGNLYKKL